MRVEILVSWLSFTNGGPPVSSYGGPFFSGVTAQIRRISTPSGYCWGSSFLRITMISIVVVTSSRTCQGQDGVQTPVAPAGRDVEKRWSTYVCGPNCLYALLKLHGLKIDYDDLMSMLPRGGKGVSLRAMQDAARGLGIDTRVVHGQYAQLRRAAFPLIVHLKPPPGDQDGVGHYVVVLNATDERIFVLDAQIGSFSSYDQPRFEQLWSGYALCVQQPRWSLLSPSLTAGAFCLAVLVLTAGLACRPIRQRARDLGAK